jgi:hypothetical protein
MAASRTDLPAYRPSLEKVLEAAVSKSSVAGALCTDANGLLLGGKTITSLLLRKNNIFSI